jgi:hypothetical protein
VTLRRIALAAIAAIAGTIGPAPSAIASPAAPAELEVVGGGGWSADTGFSLTWRPEAAGPSPVAAHYEVADDAGEIVAGPRRIGLFAGQHTIGVTVPPVTGVYGAAVWLEDPTGAEGAAAAVKLRFDRARPALAEPRPATGWISRTELPFSVRLTHPAGPLPASGIRGYAVSVDGGRESSPCAGPDRCTDAETDLRGGIEDDTLAVGELPEGRSYVHTLAVSGSGMRSVEAGHAELWVDRTDPVTRLSGAPSGWTNHPVELEATATDSLSGMAGGENAPFTAIRIDQRPPVVAAGDTVRATVIASGAHTVFFYARDAAGNVDDGADANGRPNAPPASLPLRIDREPPAVAFTGSTAPDEPELIEARVRDALSGPDPLRGEIAVRAVGSDEPFRPLPTVGAAGILLARWNSDAYATGEYEFRATGYDAAGNATSSSRRANGAPMVLPNPLKSRSILVGRLGAGLGRGTRAPVLRYGRRATFRGRLIATSDSPLGGRSVDVVERFEQGAPRRRRVTGVPTDAAGRFRVRLPPGPSREVFAVFGGTSVATGTSSRPLRLGVRSGVRLRASARLARVGGRPIVFRGLVASSPGELPPDGATVQLQFRAAGLPWSEFRTVRTNRRGRFRYAYRFSDDDSRGIRFRFRGFVPAQSDWPYEPGGSRPVAVRGY